ncbi:MAG: Calx-beta domain-containing protein [Caldilineaceae bacterium]
MKRHPLAFWISVILLAVLLLDGVQFSSVQAQSTNLSLKSDTITLVSAAPTVQFSAATYSVNENGGSINLQVTLSAAIATPVNVNYTTSDGTANQPGDYAASSGTLTFLPGETNKTFSVLIINDNLPEANEVFNVTLSNVTGGATLAHPGDQAVVTIIDDDPAPSLQFSSATYATIEGSVVNVVVRLSQVSGSPVTVNYATSDGTAKAPADYTASSGTLTFAPGDTSKTLSVATVNDTLSEPNETFTLALSNLVNATMGTPSVATVTIIDNDPTCYTLTTSVNPSAGGAVSSTPAPNCAGNKYTQGTLVSLSATANTGYAFSQWSGAASGNANPLNVTMDGNKNITANFVQLAFIISGQVTNNSGAALSGVTISATGPTNMSTTTDSGGNYTLSNLVAGTYTVTPSKSSYTFSPPSRVVIVPPNAAVGNFIGAVSNRAPVANAQNVTTVQNTPVNIMLTASDADNNPLTYRVVNNPSHGTLSGTPPNLIYTPNSSFSGTDSFTFVANDGQVDSNIATISLTISALPPPCYTLTTSVNPNGGGTVANTPPPNCQGNQYTKGTVVSLSATANMGYGFNQWSGAASGNVNPLALTMDGNKNITANFSTLGFSCSNVTEIPQNECEALVVLYNSTNGPNWTNHSNWLVTTTPCSWYGIVCRNNYVNALTLTENQLSGDIPTQLINLTNLENLDLSINSLTGNIPAQLGSLTGLSWLKLGENQLNSNIPPELGNLSNLLELSLNDNQLSGGIPSQLGNLHNLTTLDLYGNQLSGEILSQLGNLTGLTSLSLGYNQFSGNLPIQLGDLIYLTDLSLNNNQFTGALPSSLIKLTKLTTFSFQNTSLCEPPDTTFQSWLVGIATLQRTNVKCVSTYLTSGRVTDANNNSVPGVIISDGAGHVATTDANGNYTISALTAGSYTLTPSKNGYTFSPASRMVSIPPNATMQDFIGTPASGCRVIGNIKVCANSFTDSASGWTATGIVSIGDYTTVENASISANNNILTGSGLVSLITKADGSTHTLIFHDSFNIDTSSGVLTPQAVSGYQFLLTNLAGFSLQQDLYQLTLNVLTGQLNGSVNLALVIPQNRVIKTVGFKLDHTGAINATVAEVNFSLGLVTLNIKQAELGPTGLAISQAELQLPAGLGGAKAELMVANALITSDGQFTLANGSVSFEFPNIHVGGDQGFDIQGANTTLSINNGEYRFTGKGSFTLPGLGPSTAACQLGISFTLASTPPPVREASLSIEGCIKIPIGSTGFFLTSVSGDVTLDETTVAIDLGIGVEGGPDIPGLGAAINGTPTAHWDNSWSIGLSGDLKVFRWNAANASLNLDPRNGLVGTLQLSVLGVIDGNGKLRVWKDQSKFHITGRADVSVQIPAGAILHQCSSSVINVCVTVPPQPIVGPNASSDFGEFRISTSALAYGMKGQVHVMGYNPAFFLDANGRISFDLGGLQQYQLVDQPPIVQSSLAEKRDIAYPITVGNTPALIVAMGRDRSNLTVSLTDPTGRLITSATSDPAIFYTSTETQTLYTVANPQHGNWLVTVGNRTGNESYLLQVIGAPVAAKIIQPPVLIANNNGYVISLQVTGAPTATYSLFYDNDGTGNDGKPIITGVPVNQTSVNWNTSAVPQGSYYVYALLDDPFNAPIIAYNATPVSIIDSAAPDTPTNLHVVRLDSQLRITWQASLASNTAGYRIYYREPNGGTTFVADIPNRQQTSYTQQGIYLQGDWEVAISAYDINGKESARSATVVSTNQLNNLYLPFVTHR